jgi:hypothetical protein
MLRIYLYADSIRGYILSVEYRCYYRGYHQQHGYCLYGHCDQCIRMYRLGDRYCDHLQQPDRIHVRRCYGMCRFELHHIGYTIWIYLIYI